MGFLSDRNKKLDLLMQTQASLEATQKNTEKLANAVTKLLQQNQEIKENCLETPGDVLRVGLVPIKDTDCMSEDEKWKAVYALNLCTVSISRIIESNDLRVMDQEYEGILNNLNLEQMPKDEALLNVIKQILDVITFFRIQEGEKKLLNEEYQQKIQNAIWSAIPSPSMIIAGGSAGSAALTISVAATVGTAYMNYRKEKASVNLEQRRKEWEMQRSAIEQLNGLRRELFEAAWRLSDKYQFNDAMRLTERQIAQFNEILEDTEDHLRRYERLLRIKDCYEAYPPFWYHMGAAALAYARTMREANLAECKEYLNCAGEWFEKFTKANAKQKRLLREDPVVAQCSLETVDLLWEKKKLGMLSAQELEQLPHKIDSLLEDARKASGNSFDVLQMCALYYLRNNETEQAEGLFLNLVNEKYNSIVNAQLLSVIYVKQMIQNESKSPELIRKYERLAQRTPGENVLFPVPALPTNTDYNRLERDFVEIKKAFLLHEYKSVLESYAKRYDQKFKMLWNSEGNITEKLIDLLDQMCQVDSICGNTGDGAGDFTCTLVAQVKNIAEKDSSDKNKATWVEILSDRKKRKSISNGYSVIVGKALSALAQHLKIMTSSLDTLENISLAESALLGFCAQQNIQCDIRRSVIISSDDITNASVRDQITAAVRGEKIQDTIKDMEKAKEFIAAINKDRYKGIVQGKNTTFRHTNFDISSYKKKTEKYIPADCGKIIAVIEGEQDLMFTTAGIYIRKPRPVIGKRNFEKADYSNDINASKKKKVALEFTCGEKTVIYNEKDLDYSLIDELLCDLKEIHQKYAVTPKDREQPDNYLDAISQYFTVPITLSLKESN